MIIFTGKFLSFNPSNDHRSIGGGIPGAGGPGGRNGFSIGKASGQRFGWCGPHLVNWSYPQLD